MNKAMKEKLVKFLNDHSATVLETAGTHTCNLTYRPSCSSNKFTISIAFTTHLHSVDPVDYIVGNYGYALILPSYWLSISTDLSYPFIEYYVDKYMKENIFGNGSNGGNTGSDGDNDNNKPGCGCCPNHPSQPEIPPCPSKPPLEKNIHDEPTTALDGYFIDNK